MVILTIKLLPFLLNGDLFALFCFSLGFEFFSQEAGQVVLK